MPSRGKMMSESPDTEYIPTLSDIRSEWIRDRITEPYGDCWEHIEVLTEDVAEARFDRALAAHDAEVAAAERERCARIAEGTCTADLQIRSDVDRAVASLKDARARLIAGRIREGNANE